ncbi:hypothetical protein vBVpaS1601_69 [Vibrio phage vB_VpaS_1601]|uniref:hypothetical protein n=1 Tax=Vibrio phage SHOU24 TaxID=1414739 RepID=UPI0003ED22C2|nr:hypothetical protein SHOU24_12 [Vibrio phage SHOU24]AHI61209.1 hypothetical protein SHOU24_12 [Vibrio phage SHOU24]WHM52762.1 hypothetical protein vBVpaP1601_69 [Vibrio phage vB_VpaP_1601]
MKNKVVHNIVEMRADQETPDLDVRVTTCRKNEVHPFVNLMLTEKDKYASVDVDTYQDVYDTALDWDTTDIVRFTLQWPNGDTVTITRAYLADVYDMPLVESVMASVKGEVSGMTYVRQDTLATYKLYASDKRKNLPNIKTTESFMYLLSMQQDLDWETILKCYNEQPEVKEVLLEKTPRSEERFILDHAVRKEIKFIVDSFGIKSHMVNSRTLARHALRIALKSVVDAIGHQVYGKDYDIENIFNADVHFDTLGLHTQENKHGFKYEKVYAVDTGVKLFLVFGALDNTDAKSTFVTQFDLDESDLETHQAKEINFIYHNLTGN